MYNIIDKSCLFIINTLYQQSVFCIILFILIFALSRFFKVKSPGWQLGLWSLILIRLLLPTDLSFSFSARNLLDEFAISDNLNISITKVSESLNSMKEAIQNPEYSLSGPAAMQENKIENASQNLNEDINAPVPWPVILSLIWFIGCLLFLTLFLVKISSIHRVLKHSSLIKDNIITNLVDYWRHSYRIKRSVKVFSSSEFLSPFTVGVIHPRIFIPAPLLENMADNRINSIIAHEMAHIKHFDYFWLKLQNVLQIIYFFHPVIWYANRQMNIAREQVCDSIVLRKHIIHPKEYGKSVLDVLEFHLSGYRFIEPLIFFSSHKKIYEHRLKAIIRNGVMSKQKPLYIFFMVCLLGLFLLPMSNAKIGTKKPEISDEPLSLVAETSRISIDNYSIVAEMQDHVTAPVEQDFNKEETAVRKLEDNETVDEQHNIETVETVSDPQIDNRLEQNNEFEIKATEISTKEVINHAESLKPASNEKKVNPVINNVPGPDETVAELVMATSEIGQQQQDSPVDYTALGKSYIKKENFDDAISDLNKEAPKERSTDIDKMEYTLPEITVKGDSSMHSLRMEVINAEELKFEVFNNLNSTDDFDITCEWRAPTGSRIKQWSCEVGYMKKARADDVRELLLSDQLPRTDYQLAIEFAHKTRALNREMITLAVKHPELAIAMVNANELQKLYNAERRERYKDSIFIGHKGPKEKDILLNKFDIWQAAFQDHSSGAMPDKIWKRWDSTYRKIFHIKSYRDLWKSASHNKYEVRFAAYVDKIVSGY